MSSREQTVYLFADFELRCGERTLLRRGRPVAAEPKVLAVVAHLVEHGHCVV